ncbi:unnamed protein product [Onchocerca flexuosa]|uniref:DUF1758 domain-containing protein n=1 Tax=Onchocerca flexuosa TaxID=387005 RepID=A0A183I5Y6_9BILA|nr:unnamed protein product [Onchocerca flexuosa]
MDSKIIPLKVNVLEYLTNPLPVVSFDQHKVSTILNQFRIDGELKRKKPPDILIGVDYFSEFIQFKKSRKTKSGFSLIKTKVDPIWTGKGYIKELCNINKIITHPKCAIMQNVTSPNISVIPTTVLLIKPFQISINFGS